MCCVAVADCRQIDYVPKEWRDRLPGWAHHSLLTRYARFHGGELHRAVMDLMLGYKENHGLEFPAIPAPPLLFLYIRDLALPRTYTDTRKCRSNKANCLQLRSIRLHKRPAVSAS